MPPTDLNPDEEFEEERDDAVIAKAFKWSVVVIAVVATGVGATLWLTRDKVEPEVTTDGSTVLPNLDAGIDMDLPKIPFVDFTKDSGIKFVHERGASKEKLLPETMGGSCAVIDFNSDGLQDLVFINSKKWDWEADDSTAPATLSAWENKGDMTFEEVTRSVGLDISIYGMGAAVGDFDNDGDSDLYVTAVGANLLLRNDGGKFVNITATSGVAGDPEEWSTSCGWLDFDNDGDLDLFVCNYVDWDRKTDVAQDSNFAGNEVGYGRPDQFSGTFPYLFRNDGDEKFTDVSEEAGIQIKNTTTGVPVAKSLGVAFADFDGDSYLDIVVANDTVRNFLFHNNGDSTFTEIGSKSGIAFSRNGDARGAMGIDIAWFRNDVSLGVAIGNFANEQTALYVSTGGMFFTDEAVANGLGAKTRLDLTFAACWGDFDLDGRLDLFAANGHLEENIHRIQQSQHYAQPPQLFWNCGAEHATEFEPLSKTECGDEFFEPLVGRGAALADFDNDGDLDIVIVASGQAARLLRNEQSSSSANWLRFALQGTTSNRSAIGATVEVTSDGVTQRRMVSSARGYLSAAELPVSFGLGESQTAQVRIVWPNGEKQDVKVDGVNKVYRVSQSPAATK
jgi:enediyne biosynthesis protein E4